MMYPWLSNARRDASQVWAGVASKRREKVVAELKVSCTSNVRGPEVAMQPESTIAAPAKPHDSAQRWLCTHLPGTAGLAAVAGSVADGEMQWRRIIGSFDRSAAGASQAATLTWMTSCRNGDVGGNSRSLSDLEIVGCKSTAAVHF